MTTRSRTGSATHRPSRLRDPRSSSSRVCALLLPFALAASVPALAWAYADGSAPARFALVRVAISLALLGIPAAAMGATFPIAADWYRAQRRRHRGLLYAVNTAGAAARRDRRRLLPDSRASACARTTWVGVLLNLIAAAGAWWLASRSRSEETAEHAKTAENSFSEEQENQDSALRASPRSPRSPRFLPVVSPALALRGGGDLRLRRADLRSRLDAAARARHRADDLRVRDDGGGVHQRAGDRIGARHAAGAPRRAAGRLAVGDARRVGDRGRAAPRG